MERSVVIRLLERVEAWAYRRADAVVSVTDSFVSHIAARRGRHGIHVIKNGVDLTQFVIPDPDAAAAFRAEHGLTGKFVAAYVGTHGMAHGLDTILDAAERLRSRDDIAFLMVGGGAERARLMAARDQRGLTNVIMLDQLPKSAMPMVWGVTDAALVLLKRLDTFKSVLPSKIFEAMALRCPIVLGVEGEAKALVDAGSAGIAITPEDDAQLADAITRLVDDRALGASLGQSGRTFVEREFDRAQIATRYLEVMQGLVSARR
jgi:colanic acid biosynthesis glycosyl transferase WcaI